MGKLARRIMRGLARLEALRATGIFHTVIAGEYDRSRQVGATDLRRHTERHGIRSAVNLRGAKPGAGWHDEEIAASAELGLTHCDFPMSSARALDAGQAAELLAILRAAPKPVLVHCQHGADRTGLASSLCLAAIAGRGGEAAEWQLSFLYGHIAIPRLSHA